MDVVASAIFLFLPLFSKVAEATEVLERLAGP